MESNHAKPKDPRIKKLNLFGRPTADADKRQGRLEASKMSPDETSAGEVPTEETLRMAQLIVDKSPAVIFRRTGGDMPRLVDISDNIRQFGYSPEEFLSGSVTFKDIVHPDDTDRVEKELKGYAGKGVEEYTRVYRILTKNGQFRWVEEQTSVERDTDGRITFSYCIMVDITTNIRAEERLYRSEEKYRRIVETTGEGFILMDQGLKITDANDAFCRMMGYSREELRGKTPLDLAADRLREFMATNREKLLALEHRKLEGNLIAKNGRHIPILINGNTLRDEKGEVIGNVAFVTDMTEQKKALALAAEVQKSLLPHKKPQIQGLDVAGKYISCEEIGGDYFDFLQQEDYPNAHFSVAVGDVTGHGVDAALLMATARAFLRMSAARFSTIAQIITETNRRLAQDVSNTYHFMTLFFLALDPKEKHIRWVGAGHDPAVFYDPVRGRFEQLKGRGIALGVDENFVYEESRKTGLSPGQIIAIGTDGIWESRNKNGEMFGKKRFRDIIREKADADAEGILNAVYDEINRFTRGVASDDDITLVVIKVVRTN